MPRRTKTPSATESEAEDERNMVRSRLNWFRMPFEEARPLPAFLRFALTFEGICGDSNVRRETVCTIRHSYRIPRGTTLISSAPDTADARLLSLCAMDEAADRNGPAPAYKSS